MTRVHPRRLGGLLLLLCAACQPAPPEAPAIGGTPAKSPVQQTGTSVASAPQPPAEAMWTLPGRFRADTDAAQLRAWFGAENVRVVDDLPLAEGDTTRGVVLFPDDPARRALIFFHDAAALRGINSVRIETPGSRWQFDDGLRIGSTLAEVIARNGKPVGFYGFNWDYGGFVSDWNGGRLASTGAMVRGIRLAPRDPSDADVPSGDGEFRSDDPTFPRLAERVVISELQLAFPANAPD